MRLGRLIKDLIGTGHGSLDHLQSETDEALSDWAHRAIFPISGDTVHDTWMSELPSLTPLPETMPEPFDVVVERPVQNDCTIHFEG